MSESRKSDSEPKDGDNTITDGDKEFRNSRLSLSKDKSPDGAHEKLLAKDDEAKIVRVDMDAKYVCGDQRNGDPKIELDANKKQFSGLTKEELMKYADDPFWVRLRWFMFALFWALWLGMLAGAIIIIVKAPKCAPPAPRTWAEKGPLAELDSQDYADVEAKLPLLQASKVEGIFLRAEAYDALDKPDALDKLKQLVETARKYSVKIILDLTPNYVSSSHPWFVASLNNTAPFADFFTWKTPKKFDADEKPLPFNNWVSTLNTPAWTYSEERKSLYLNQFGADKPDLNFRNADVRARLSEALTKWMSTGAGGVRLNNARQMLVDASFPDEEAAVGRGTDYGAGHTSYPYYSHKHTMDQPGLDDLLTTFADNVAKAADNKETVFTLKEEGASTELYLGSLFNATRQRPPSAAPVAVVNATAAAALLLRKINDTGAPRGKPRSLWPLVQLKGDTDAADRELALFAQLLPAAPVLNVALINNASAVDLSSLHKLRSDASVEHGEFAIVAVRGQRDDNTTVPILACARWKAGHTGYLALFNPSGRAARADASGVPSVPDAVTLYHVSAPVRDATNYTENVSERADRVLVPARAAVLLSYVPHAAAAAAD